MARFIYATGPIPAKISRIHFGVDPCCWGLQRANTRAN